jgi:two-component system response regulator MprA
LDGDSWGEAATGQQALTLARQKHWDLLLLDWSLPDCSGVEIYQRLRLTCQHRLVLMLTDRDDVKERVEALARMRARLRRGAAGSDDGSNDLQSLQLADLELFPASREVRRAGAKVELNGKDFELLHLLIRRPNQGHSRGAILEAIWGENWVGDDNILDECVRTQRRKIERP